MKIGPQLYLTNFYSRLLTITSILLRLGPFPSFLLDPAFPVIIFLSSTYPLGCISSLTEPQEFENRGLGLFIRYLPFENYIQQLAFGMATVPIVFVFISLKGATILHILRYESIMDAKRLYTLESMGIKCSKRENKTQNCRAKHVVLINNPTIMCGGRL